MDQGKKRQRHRGFTLIELLIVVGILAVVAAIAIPNLTRFKGSGEEESFDADKSAIQTACEAYYYKMGVHPLADGSTPSVDIIFSGHVDLNANGSLLDDVTINGTTYDEDVDNTGLVDLSYLVEIPESSDDAADPGSYDWELGSNGEVTTTYSGEFP
jgi:prepilin-type N-terminal cleavage/methylation domain-containing protein